MADVALDAPGKTRRFERKTELIYDKMRTTRLSLTAALCLGAFLASGMFCFAQNNRAEKGKAVRGAPAIEQRVERMAKDLDLTAQQKTKLQAFLEEHTKKMQALRAETGLSRQEMGEKSRALRDAYQAKMKEILTPEQLAKMEKQRQENREKFQKRGGEKKKKNA